MDMRIQTESTQGTWKGLAVGIAVAFWWVLTTVVGGALWLLQKVTSTLDAHNTMGSLVNAAGEVIRHMPNTVAEPYDDGYAKDGEPGLAMNYDGDTEVTYYGPCRHKL